MPETSCKSINVFAVCTANIVQKVTLLLKLIVSVPETSCKELHQYLDTACNFPQWVTSLHPSAGYFLHIFTHELETYTQLTLPQRKTLK